TPTSRPCSTTQAPSLRDRSSSSARSRTERVGTTVSASTMMSRACMPGAYVRGACARDRLKLQLETAGGCGQRGLAAGVAEHHGAADAHAEPGELDHAGEPEPEPEGRRV